MSIVLMNEDQKHSKNSLSMRRMLPIALMATGFAVFMGAGGHEYISFQTLSEHREDIIGWCENNMIMAVLTFIVVYTLMTALSIPGAIWITISGGFIFGLGQGFVYVLISATCGAILIFLAARYAFADFFHAKAGPTLHRMEDGFRKNALSYLLFLRLVPVFPFWLVNLVPALLGVRLRTYFIATFFGIMPGSLVYTWVGSGLGEVLERGEMPDLGIIFEPAILFPMIGLAILSMVPVIYNRVKSSRQNNQNSA